MKMKCAVIPVIFGSLALSGCGTQTRESAFTDVQNIVGERHIDHVQWNQNAAEDEQAAHAVHELLANALNVDSAVQIALVNNRDLQATYEELGIAQADLVRAGLLRNPVFSADAKFHPGGGVRLEFSLVEDFLDLFFIPMRKRLAAAAFESAKLRVAGAVIDLAGETRIAFYRLQMAGQSLDMRRTVVEATSLSSDLAQRIQAAGNSTFIDAAQEQALFEQAKLDLAASELDVIEQREQLNMLMGIWGSDTIWTCEMLLPELPAEEMDLVGLEKRAIARSIDLDVTKNVIERNAQLLGIARPFGAVSEANLGVAGEKEIDGTRSIGPALSVPLPVFNAGESAVNAARAELRQSQDRYAAQAIHIRSNVRIARARLLVARSRAEYLKRVIIPLRQRVVEGIQTQYNGMLASPFRLIQAKEQEIEAGAQYVQALGAYWIARANLEQLLNGRMSSQVMLTMQAATADGSATERGH